MTSTYNNDELPDEIITTARFCRVSSRFISICDSFVFVVVVFRYRYYCYCYSRYSRSRTRNLNRKNRKNPKSPTRRRRRRRRRKKRSLFSLFLSLAPSLSVLCRPVNPPKPMLNEKLMENRTFFKGAFGMTLEIRLHVLLGHLLV